MLDVLAFIFTVIRGDDNMEISNLYKNINYRSNINFLVSTYIREYDISKANISVLYEKKVISKDMYIELYNAPNHKRKVMVGLLLRRNPKYVEILKQGIMEAKEKFFKANNIKDEEVLAIKNDAVFLINKIANVTKFNNIEFKMKNVYTSYYKIDNLEFYYFYESYTGREKLDVKGISDEQLEKHKSYFLEFLEVCFNSAEIENIDETLDIVINFYQRYIGLKLELGYYREFNSLSRYSLKSFSQFSKFYAEYLSEEDKLNIDITFNLNIIRILFQYYSSIHMDRKNR